jgi:hypothetical protein
MWGAADLFKRIAAAWMPIGATAVSPGSFGITLALAGFALGMWCQSAAAGNIATSTVDTTAQTGFASDNLSNTTGTVQLFVYSYQNVTRDAAGNQTAPPLGPNDQKSVSSVGAIVTTSLNGRNVVPGTLTYVQPSQPITVNTGVLRQNPAALVDNYTMRNAQPTPEINYYQPTVGLAVTMGTAPNTTTVPVAIRKNSIANPGDNVTLTSTSGAYSATAKAFVSSGGVRGILADATGTPPPGGRSAARAFDPIDIPSGTAFSYSPTISATVQLGSAGIDGGFAYFAVDSSVFTSDTVDNYVQDGAPFDGSLWYLTVGGDSPTASTSDAQVDFQLNPLALNEIQLPTSFIASLGPFTDTDSEVLLIDSAIDQSIGSQLTLNGNTVGLDNVNVFPTGTTFGAINGGVEYAEDVDAALTTAPEPASLVILATGLLACAAMRRVPKRV